MNEYEKDVLWRARQIGYLLLYEQIVITDDPITPPPPRTPKSATTKPKPPTKRPADDHGTASKRFRASMGWCD